MSRAALAKLIRRPPSALSSEKITSATRTCFEPLTAILNKATEMSMEESHAVHWFKHHPIVGMGDVPAMEHVANGRAAHVLLHLRAVENGVYA